MPKLKLTKSRDTTESKDQEQTNLKVLSELEIKEVQQRNANKYGHLTTQTKKRVLQAQQIFQSSKTILDEHKLDSIISNIALKVSRTLKGAAPLVLTLYPQGAHFSNRLTEQLGDLDLTLEENYLDLEVKGDDVIPRAEPLVSLEGRTILIVDTILRDGEKMQAALDYCQIKKARAVYCAVLIDMPKGRTTAHRNLQPSFYGAARESQTLIGFGYDVEGFFSSLPGLKVLSQPNASNTNTATILAALDAQSTPKPLIFNDQIPADAKALAKAKQAEQTFTGLELLYNKEKLEAQIKLTAQQMAAALKDSYPVVLSMQKGGSHFTSHLTEQLQLQGLPLEESYMHISRYGNSKQGGKAKIIAPPAVDIEGRTVIIADDIVEGGLTMQMAISLCLKKGASAVYIATMGDKPQKRLAESRFIKPDFYCYQFDDRFLVGMGLDEKENLRNKMGVWAHRKQKEAAAPSKLWGLSKYVAVGGVLLFGAYKLAQEAVSQMEHTVPQLKPYN